MPDPASAAQIRRLTFHAILALLSALLLLLLFPNFDLHFLAPIALTPLLVALALTPIAPINPNNHYPIAIPGF